MTRRDLTVVSVRGIGDALVLQRAGEAPIVREIKVNLATGKMRIETPSPFLLKRVNIELRR